MCERLTWTYASVYGRDPCGSGGLAIDRRSDVSFRPQTSIRRPFRKGTNGPTDRTCGG